MPETLNLSAEPTADIEELNRLLTRARAGDRTSLPALRRVLDERGAEMLSQRSGMKPFRVADDRPVPIRTVHPYGRWHLR